MPLVPLSPGNSPQFQVTPTPAGVTTLAANTSWMSSDPVNFPVSMNADDPTGLTATVNIPASETVTESVTLAWSYTNSDGTVANATASFNLVSGVAEAVDVTGGTLAQIV